MRLRNIQCSMHSIRLRPLYALCVVFCLCGCSSRQTHIAQKPPSQQAQPINAGDLDYRVGCPDVLRIAVPNHPNLTGQFRIGPDGRINLGPHGELRVEGRTTAEIAQRLASYSGAYPQFVTADVAEYNSRRILLFGEVVGWQRSVPYRGPEPVTDVVRRAGGLTSGAAPEKVYVVRTHIADGGRPEIYHIDWQSITKQNDQKSNVTVQPFDQIYVGETHRSRIGKCFPRYMKAIVRFFTREPTPRNAEPAPNQQPRTRKQRKQAHGNLQI